MDNSNFRFVKESITDREAVYKLFEEEQPDVVVNFAAESHVDRSIENPEVFLDTNIKGTAVLMDACRKYGIKRYHQVSSDEVYGDLPLDRADLFFTEETPIHTSSPYSSSKASEDLLVLAYHRTYGLPVSISRCSNNYGPYHFPEKLIPLMIANCLNDKPLPVYGEGLNVTANFLPPRIFNSKLLQYPKAKVIQSWGSDCVDLMLICQRCQLKFGEETLDLMDQRLAYLSKTAPACDTVLENGMRDKCLQRYVNKRPITLN